MLTLIGELLAAHTIGILVVTSGLMNIGVAWLIYRRLYNRSELSLRVLHGVFKKNKNANQAWVETGAGIKAIASAQLKIHDHQRIMLASLLRQATSIENMLAQPDAHQNPTIRRAVSPTLASSSLKAPSPTTRGTATYPNVYRLVDVLHFQNSARDPMENSLVEELHKELVHSEKDNSLGSGEGIEKVAIYG